MCSKPKELEKLLEIQIKKALETMQTLPGLLPVILKASELLISTLQKDGKVLTAGNGGSAAEAMHMAEELSGRYKGNRRSLPALSIVSDGTVLSCIANDFGYDSVFARQIEGLGRKGDLLVLFSTSGSAANLDLALQKAKAAGMRVLTILGRDGGALAGRADVEIIVPAQDTEHIQEVHQVILHLLLGTVEHVFPPESPDA